MVKKSTRYSQFSPKTDVKSKQSSINSEVSHRLSIKKDYIQLVDLNQ